MEETDCESDTLASEIKTRRRIPMDQREEICRLLFEGISRRQVAKRMGLSPSVVSRLEKKLQETGTLEDRHRAGRPRLAHQPSEHWIKLEGEYNKYKYQCMHCQKLFVHHAKIREHLRTHTGERPYKCDRCFLGFATTTTLKRHLVTHTDEKHFMCDFCAKQFADSGSLRIHRRIHTGDKPYKCDFCDRRCVTRGNLNAHMRIHRDEEKILEGESRGRGRRRKAKKLVLSNDTSENDSSDHIMEYKYTREGTIKDSGESVGDIMKEMIDDKKKYTDSDHDSNKVINNKADNRLCSIPRNCDNILGNRSNDVKTHDMFSSKHCDSLAKHGKKLEGDDKLKLPKIETNVELDYYPSNSMI